MSPEHAILLGSAAAIGAVHTLQGLGLVPARRLSRYGHALAGALAFLGGVAIQLGL